MGEKDREGAGSLRRGAPFHLNKGEKPELTVPVPCAEPLGVQAKDHGLHLAASAGHKACPGPWGCVSQSPRPSGSGQFSRQFCAGAVTLLILSIRDLKVRQVTYLRSKATETRDNRNRLRASGSLLPLDRRVY